MRAFAIIQDLKTNPGDLAQNLPIDTYAKHDLTYVQSDLNHLVALQNSVVTIQKSGYYTGCAIAASPENSSSRIRLGVTKPGMPVEYFYGLNTADGGAVSAVCLSAELPECELGLLPEGTEIELQQLSIGGGIAGGPVPSSIGGALYAQIKIAVVG